MDTEILKCTDCGKELVAPVEWAKQWLAEHSLKGWTCCDCCDKYDTID